MKLQCCLITAATLLSSAVTYADSTDSHNIDVSSARCSASELNDVKRLRAHHYRELLVEACKSDSQWEFCGLLNPTLNWCGDSSVFDLTISPDTHYIFFKYQNINGEEQYRYTKDPACLNAHKIMTPGSMLSGENVILCDAKQVTLHKWSQS